jgi:hypothetical protein
LRNGGGHLGRLPIWLAQKVAERDLTGVLVCELKSAFTQLQESKTSLSTSSEQQFAITGATVRPLSIMTKRASQGVWTRCRVAVSSLATPSSCADFAGGLAVKCMRVIAAGRRPRLIKKEWAFNSSEFCSHPGGHAKVPSRQLARPYLHWSSQDKRQ